MLSSVLLAIWLCRRRELPFWKVWWMLLLAVLGAFASARLSWLFFDSDFADFGDLKSGGEVSYGAILGGLTVAMVWALIRGLRLPDVLDAAAPAIFAGEGIQRIGCFCNGCCYGPVGETFLSVQFPKILSPDGVIVGTPCFLYHLNIGLVQRGDILSLPVIPIQLFSMTVCLVIAGVSLCLFLKDKLKGCLIFVAFASYGVLRFILQWFRPNYDFAEETYTWNKGHTMAVIMALVGLFFVFMRWRLGADWAGFDAAKTEKDSKAFRRHELKRRKRTKQK